MSDNKFELNAEPRNDLGKGKSRRLRRAGKIPAILYGGQSAPLPITLSHSEILRRLEHEAFYSHVLNVRIGNNTEHAILKDIHRHPAKPTVMHIDLQRIDPTHKIHMRVPLHFLNEISAPGVKISGGSIGYLLKTIEVECLIKDLPEYIEVDLANLEIGQTIHISDIKIPNGVTVRGLASQPVVNITSARTGDNETPTEAAPAAAAPAPAASPAKKS